MQNEWIKLSLVGKQTDVEILTAVISMIDNGVMIEDYSDVSTDGLYGALIDESILNADKTKATVSVFLPAERSLSEAKAFLSERISTLALDATVTTEGMCEEDWAEAWKKYYHPIRIGRITVVPAWEEYTPADGELILRMDPGIRPAAADQMYRLFIIHLCQVFLDHLLNCQTMRLDLPSAVIAAVKCNFH